LSKTIEDLPLNQDLAICNNAMIYLNIAIPTMLKEGKMSLERNLSIPGGLTGALIGLTAELALEEITGMEVVNGLLAVIGAGFGLIRIDRRIYEATVNLVKKVPVEPTSDYRDVLEQIDEMSVELPELRESFVKLIRAGMEAQRA
jgi:hypothetical protein